MAKMKGKADADQSQTALNVDDALGLPNFSQDLFQRLVNCTRASNNLPAKQEYHYHQSFPQFNQSMKQYGDRISALLRNLITFSDLEHADEVGTQVEDFVDRPDAFIDSVDVVLERVDTALDEHKGIDNNPKVPVNAKVDFKRRNLLERVEKRNEKSFSTHNANKPQHQWMDTVDNSNTPFIPKLLDKPNAKVPLDSSILEAQKGKEKEAQQAPLSSSTKRNKEKIAAHVADHLKGLGVNLWTSFPHPYEYELNSIEYTEKQLQRNEEQLYKPLADTPFLWVDTKEKLETCLEHLNQVDEIAIDLENHNYRSYQGFVCLMQISTRDQDFVIDTLLLRRDMHILNQPFTNPRIVKVLHGADMDILWLQRDFGLYIVNMFDTGQASRTLAYPSFGLAYLLKFYCDVDADKKYQMADWRQRPLPEEMLKYAREDTHYLLYVYDRMKNALLDNGNETDNLLRAVLTRSNELSLKRYEKEHTDDRSHEAMCAKHGLLFNPTQMRVLKAVYQWRDETARREDESVRFVMPNHVLFHIASRMPVTAQELFACCNPVPALVRLYGSEIAHLIVSARAEPDASPATRPVAPLSSSPSSSSAASASASASSSSSSSSSASVSSVGATITAASSVKVGSTSAVVPTSQTASHLFGAPSSSPTPKSNGRPHAVPSPVLSTKQLYETAGWVKNDSLTNVPAIPWTPSSKRAIYPEQSPSSLLFDSSESSEDEEDRRNKQRAEEVRQSFKNVTTTTPDATATTAENQLKDQVTGEPTAADGSRKRKAEGDGPEAVKRVSFNPVESVQVFSPSEAKIPKSVKEIYKISNNNRKRNKEKKRLKDDATGQLEDEQISDEEDAPGKKKRKVGGSAAADTVEFLTKIGWMNETDATSAVVSSSASGKPRTASVDVEPSGSLSGQQKGHHRRSKSDSTVVNQFNQANRGGKKGQQGRPQPPPDVIPFDYSKGRNIIQPSDSSSRALPPQYFNPYSEAGQGRNNNRVHKDRSQNQVRPRSEGKSMFVARNQR